MMKWLTRDRHVEGKYDFHIQYEPASLDSSSTLALTVFSDAHKKAIVPCTFRWSLIRNDLPQELESKGSSFVCEPSHVGCTVQAEIKSKDPEYPGTAILTLGPVVLDTTLRTQIGLALSQGQLSLPVLISGGSHEGKQCTVRVVDGQLRLAHAYSDANYAFDYSLCEPTMVVSCKETTLITFLFSPRYEEELSRFKRKIFQLHDSSQSRISVQDCPDSGQDCQSLELRFVGRQNRDLLVFVMKAFMAQKELRSAVVMRKLEDIKMDQTAPFDVAMELTRLKTDLLSYHTLLQQARTELATKHKSPPSPFKQSTHDTQLQFKQSIYCNNVVSVPLRSSGRLSSSPYLQHEMLSKNLNNKIMALTEQIEQVQISPEQLKKSPLKTADLGIQDLLHKLNATSESPSDLSQQIRLMQAEKIASDNKLAVAEEKLAFAYKKIETLEGTVNGQSQQLANANRPQNIGYYSSTQHKAYNSAHLNPASHQFQNGPAINFCYNGQKTTETIKFTQNFEGGQTSNENTRLQANSARLLAENTCLAAENTRMHSDNMRLSSEIARVQTDHAKLEAEHEQLKTSLCEAEARLTRNKRKTSELEKELEMFKRNADAINRSQHMSSQLDSYNEEQIALLKQQNIFLAAENDRLAKACQRYMADAKHANRLSQEVIALKEQLRKATAEHSMSSMIV